MPQIPIARDYEVVTPSDTEDNKFDGLFIGTTGIEMGGHSS